MTQNKLYIWLALLLATFLGACSSVKFVDQEGRFYHCVALSKPNASANTLAKQYPLEAFEYGYFRDESRPNTGHHGYCSNLILPKTAYIRYRVDGRVIEKRFDLSSLTPQRVANNTVEFFVDGETVEVRLLSKKVGAGIVGEFNKEVITRQ